MILLVICKLPLKPNQMYLYKFNVKLTSYSTIHMHEGEFFNVFKCFLFFRHSFCRWCERCESGIRQPQNRSGKQVVRFGSLNESILCKCIYIDQGKQWDKAVKIMDAIELLLRSFYWCNLFTVSLVLNCGKIKQRCIVYLIL